MKDKKQYIAPGTTIVDICTERILQFPSNTVNP